MSPAPAPKKPKSDRPFWIPDDDDWKVVTDLGASTFVDAVRVWQTNNPSRWQVGLLLKVPRAHVYMNKSCPACK